MGLFNYAPASWDDERSMVPHRLKEQLLGDSSTSIHFGDSAKATENHEYESDADSQATKGVPFFHRGQCLGSTSRCVEVNRKTWDLVIARSLGRTTSCEFSTIEQANLPMPDAAPMALRSLKRRRPILENPAAPHQSVFGLPVMSPFSIWAHRWLTFMAVLDLTFTAFVVPYITAFLSHGGHLESLFIEIVDAVTGAIFMFDVFINFHIGFVISCDYRNKVEMRGKHIAWYYFKHGGAWIDIVSVVPSILGLVMLLLGALIDNAPVALIRYIRMIRIVRLLRALSKTSLLTKIESKFFKWIGPTTMYLLTVIYCLIVLVNFLGCLLYFVAVMEDSDLEGTWISRYSDDATDDSDAVHYLLGVYWAITTVTTVGYGDVVPHTWIELLLMGFVMLTQIVIFGFLIGTMTEIVTNSMKTLRNAERYKEKMESVEGWLMHYNIPDSLVETVRSFYSQVWLRKEDVDEGHVLNELPIRIRSAVVHALLGETMENLPLLCYMRKNTIFKIASRMMPLVKYPDEEIPLHRRGSEMICILEDGSVSVTTGRGLNYKHKAANIFGAGSLLLFLSDNYKPKFTWKLRAYTCCRVWCISTADFFEIIDTYEGGRNLLLKGFHQMLLDRLDRWSDERAQENILGLELGTTLSPVAASEVKREIYKDQLSIEDLVRVLSGEGETKPPLDRQSRAMEGPAVADLADQGSSSSDTDSDLYTILLGLLRKRGIHGAVEFVQELMILGEDSVAVDIFRALLEKFGMERSAVDVQALQTAKHDRIQVSDVVSKLVSLQTFSEEAKTVREAFIRIFPRGDVHARELVEAFNSKNHPDVQNRRKGSGRVLREALSILLKAEICTQDDFMLYHQ